MNPEVRAAYFADLRARQRGFQNAGYVACLIGVLTMLTGRYVAGAPSWLIFVGLGVIIIGWGLLAFAIFSRAAYMRANPYDANE